MTSRLPATARGQGRRDAILEALDGLLREGSLADVDVRTLSAEAGMTRSGFYFYFPTKEAAVAALLWDVYDEMVDSAATFFSGGAPPRPALTAALGHVAALWDAHRHLLGAMILAAAVDPEARRTWDAWTSAWVDRVALTIAEERARGVAPAGPDATSLATVLIGMNVQAFQQSGPPPLDALATAWINTIYGGPA